MSTIIGWVAGNWDDPLFLATIGIEMAIVAGMFFVPERWRRAVKQLARDTRIPLPVRLMIGFGSLPIPGPVDEIVLGAAALIMVTTPRMRAAFRDAVTTGKLAAA